MLRSLVVLFLSASGESRELPAALVTRLATLGHRAVVPAAAAPSPGYDERLISEIENALEQARTNTAEPRGVFTRVDELLFAHPELPQAAWLMAERHALEAQLHARAGDAAAAAVATERAQLLEGRRGAAAGSTETSAPIPSAPAPHATLTRGAAGSLIHTGARPADEVWLDGAVLSPGTEVRPGQHHVQLFRAQRRIAAAWVDVSANLQLHLEQPSTSCDELDLLGTAAGTGQPEPLPGVRCGEWAAARQTASGALEFAFCRGSSCEPWQAVPQLHVAANSPARASRAPAAEADERSDSPWLTWSLVGVAAAGATGLILWQAGAFDDTAPATEIVFTGPSAASIPF
jgi:hypothetical protein